MANYNTSADIVLTVNGNQAKKMLADLEKDARKLEKGIKKAAQSGDKATMQKLQRELRQTHRAMDQLRNTGNSVENVLHRIDSATPRELNKALRDLQKQLNGIERGSSAWDAQLEKIRKVKSELASVREEMTPDQSWGDRLTGFISKWGTAIAGAAASASGLIYAGKKAVNSYAEMQQEEANVRKFTGMTEEQVAALNKELKKIDTRTPREELNKLAQDAGRLGKSAHEDVLGFVRAADKINVALDDLGDGATLKLSKLTGVFGDEKRLGTEKALLSVGSVVNELSQNCSAAAPYLVEFSSRLGGVGAQADMSVPQIMGYGAVLDSNNQKVEASATALSQIIVRLYQDPAKYAKVAGMDVKNFSDLVKKDMNAALIEFLSTLNKTGGMDVLSPMFKDMGETGARAIQALSTLAAHIDEVKAQQLVANEAFKDATSIDKEFDVQNNTVQASLDKAKNKIHELAVTLGEKLMPVMRYAISGSTLTLKAIKLTIDFIQEYKLEILSTAAAIAAYQTWVNLARIKTVALTAATVAQKVAITAGRAATLLTSAAYALLSRDIGRASAAMRLFGTTLKMSPVGLALSAVVALAGGIVALIKRNREAAKAQEEMNRKQEEFRKSLRDISSAEKDYAKQSKDAAKALYDAATDETLSREKRLDAVKKLQQLYPDYFGNLKAETIMAGKAEGAYRKLAAEILRTARIRAGADKIVENEAELSGLKTEFDQKNSDVMRLADQVHALEAQRSELEDLKKTSTNRTHQISLTSKINRLNGQIEDLSKEWAKAIDAATELSGKIAEIETANEDVKSQYGITDADITASKLAGIDTEPAPVVKQFSRSETDKERKKREAEERRKATKERKAYKDDMNAAKGAYDGEVAAATVDYTQGVISWSEFLAKKHELEMAYFDEREKVLKKHNLEEDEDYQTLLKDRAEAEAKWNKTRALNNVSDAKDFLKAQEAQGRMDSLRPDSEFYQNEEALQEWIFRLRLSTLARCQGAYKEGSEEWHSYQTQIEELEANEQLRRQKMMSQKVAEWRKEYEYLEAGKRMALELDIAKQAHEAGLMTEEEYQRALADLKIKYSEDYLPESAKPAGQDDIRKRQYDKDLAQLKSLLDQKLITLEEYETAKARIEQRYRRQSEEAAKGVSNEYTDMLLNIRDAWLSFFDKTGEKGQNWATKLADLASGVFAVMTAGLEMYSEYQQACADLEVAKTEKKYEAMIKAAGDNDEAVKRLEEERDAEVSKIKKEAAEKSFALQVAQAIATTAMNAIAAFGAAQNIMYPGNIIFGTLAAALATAQGVAQLAIIKKQKEVADAQGYAEGGFTPSGGKYEAAGTVHKGEWVASQKLVNNPQVRPLLEALDYAQRNNTIGSIRMQDVSRSITAPIVLAAQPAPTPAIVASQPPTVVVEQNSEYVATMRRLADRLDEPFVTVNTVTGDNGSKRAQDEYNKLMRNKAPLSRR